MVRLLHLKLLRERYVPSRNRRLNYVLGSQKGVINMLNTILGARLSWHFANGLIFEPAIVGPDIVDYPLNARPHTGPHPTHPFYSSQESPGVDTTDRTTT